ncbi:hypothetical protein [Pseudocnuella soli]|uniref:hypothetical protein n=1 Tax=Pseudocnuella soli TaxID=2502779 RepID=UPI001049069B|nr:hypothetical protein [Pseudocnuella soli]
MSTYFSKIIKAGQRQREFNFRRLSAGPEARYHVDVNDDKGNRLIFNLIKDAGGQWKTTGTDLPEWVYGVESDLGSSIEEHLSA